VPEDFHEGRLVLRTHLERERSKELRAAVVTRLRALGELRCEVCTFDFEARYGELGRGYIEMHHGDVPLSQYPKLGKRTKPEDLRPVCANCHRVLHNNEALTVTSLRDFLARR
jgi:5-methylcytosine-specific restriction protein A